MFNNNNIKYKFEKVLFFILKHKWIMIYNNLLYGIYFTLFMYFIYTNKYAEMFISVGFDIPKHWIYLFLCLGFLSLVLINNLNYLLNGSNNKVLFWFIKH